MCLDCTRPLNFFLKKVVRDGLGASAARARNRIDEYKGAPSSRKGAIVYLPGAAQCLHCVHFSEMWP